MDWCSPNTIWDVLGQGQEHPANTGSLASHGSSLKPCVQVNLKDMAEFSLYVYPAGISLDQDMLNSSFY